MASAPGSLILAMMLTGIAIAAHYALHHVRAAEARRKALIVRRQEQVKRLRRAAGTCLRLKRECRHLRRSVELAREKCTALQQEIETIAHPASRIFVLDERRTFGDTCWLASLDAPGTLLPGQPAPAWEGTRRFRVWARDEEGVRAKIVRKYPSAAGYTLVSIAPFLK